MKTGLTLETITQGLVAVEKIRRSLGANLREDSNSAVKPDRVAVLHDALQTISEFLPAARGGSFNSAMLAGNRYSATYREIKRHLREFKGKKIDLDKVAKTMKVIMPMIGNSQKADFEKIIKIMDIISS